jgi:hypothetical protein
LSLASVNHALALGPKGLLGGGFVIVAISIAKDFGILHY